MTLQLQRHGKCSQDAWQVILKPPWEQKRRRPWESGARVQARAEIEGGVRSTLSSREPAKDSKVSFIERWKRLPASFVAAPCFSSILRQTRRRGHHELKMETRERVVLSISDWVFRSVQDPLVEIDPVTVNKAILAEKEATEKETAASTAPISVFGYNLPFLSTRANKDALVAAILLLLLALVAGTIMALGGNRKSATKTPDASSIGSSPNGDARFGDQDSGDISVLQDLGDLNKKRAGDSAEPERPGTVQPSPVEGQFTRPFSNSTTLLDHQELLLPAAGTKGDLPRKTNSVQEETILSIPEAASSSQEVDLTVPSIVNNYDVIHGGASSETDVTKLANDEEIAHNNGGTVTSSSSKKSDDLEIQSASGLADSLTEELPPSVTEAIITVELPARAESLLGPPLVPLGDGEYLLLGDSESLLPVPGPSTTEPIVAPPASAYPIVAASVAVSSEDSNDSFAVKTFPESIGRGPSDGNSAGSTMAETPYSQPSVDDIRLATESERTVEEDRKQYTEVLKKVLPAASIGAGVAALSTLAGVDGAFQMVGLFATTSFLTGSLIWAGEREQLLEDISNIKDHSQLIDFLKVRKIIPEIWNQ